MAYFETEICNVKRAGFIDFLECAKTHPLCDMRVTRRFLTLPVDLISVCIAPRVVSRSKQSNDDYAHKQNGNRYRYPRHQHRNQCGERDTNHKPTPQGILYEPTKARWFEFRHLLRGSHMPLYVLVEVLLVSVCIHHNHVMSEVLTIRVDRKIKSRLEKLARAMDRSKSYLAAEAIRAYVDLNEWQIAEIRAALEEADAGDFASDGEVDRVVKKWRRGAGKVA
jgi:RHH-type transcriptional regulator, rel operon repressor / antitoxin RelB